MAANLYRVILPTDDMQGADAFWSELLGLAVDVVVPTRHYFPTAGAILAIVDPREHGKRPTPNPDCIYIRMPDLDAAYERALAVGAPMLKDYQEPGIAKRPWGDRSFYTADAFGGWKSVTNVQAGGGLYAQRIVTRRHYDLELAKSKALHLAGMAED